MSKLSIAVTIVAVPAAIAFSAAMFQVEYERATRPGTSPPSGGLPSSGPTIADPQPPSERRPPGASGVERLPYQEPLTPRQPAPQPPSERRPPGATGVKQLPYHEPLTSRQPASDAIDQRAIALVVGELAFGFSRTTSVLDSLATDKLQLVHASPALSDVELRKTLHSAGLARAIVVASTVKLVPTPATMQHEIESALTRVDVTVTVGFVDSEHRQTVESLHEIATAMSTDTAYDDAVTRLLDRLRTAIAAVAREKANL